MPPVPAQTVRLAEASEWIRKINSALIALVSRKSCQEEYQQVVQAVGNNVKIDSFTLDDFGNKASVVQQSIETLTGRDLATQQSLVFVRGDCIGGVSDLGRFNTNGHLSSWLRPHDYDLIVIGGGSGGLAASKEAAKHGKRVCVFDFVDPTPVGTTWGLGGTCVNVGCIPKKLMHQAALLGTSISDSLSFGWDVDKSNVSHNWSNMKQAVQNYVKSLNFRYRVELREKSITYKNAKARFLDPHTVEAVDKKGQKEVITADKFVIAVGLRPRYLNIPGAQEYCITSDDIFSLGHSPGRTLCIGASYVSLETAGFLHGIGLDVAVSVRSRLLRGFDEDISVRIGKHMQSLGIKFFEKTVPVKIERLKDGKPGLYRVTLRHNSGDEIVEEFNTIMLAIGRDPVTDGLGLDEIGVMRNQKTKKIKVDLEQTTLPHIYAIGDVAEGHSELTPVAIQCGKTLARRMFGQSVLQMDHSYIPTTVFTPLEYGCVGVNEEEAIEQAPDPDDIEVYHAMFKPLEFTVPGRDVNHCYCKLITRRDQDDRVIGFHYLGPNAGEVTQGFAMALKFGACKSDFDNLVGIHPTCAEMFTKIDVTKRSGVSPESTGC